MDARACASGIAGTRVTAQSMMTTRALPPDRPPRGLILIDGVWRPRHWAFLSEREFTCWNGHRVHPKSGERPIENIIPCGYKQHNKIGAGCEARLFVFRVKPTKFFAMDITFAEDDQVRLMELDLDGILEWFGLSGKR